MLNGQCTYLTLQVLLSWDSVRYRQVPEEKEVIAIKSDPLLLGRG